VAIEVLFFDLGDTLVRGARREWIVGARELLHTLANRAFRVGILSNTGNLHSRQEILDLLPADFDLSLFEPGLVLFSSEVGLTKPDPEIFKEATRRAGIPAGRCLYCSESIPETLVAQHTGMLAVRVQAPRGGDLLRLEEFILDFNLNVANEPE
jgi:putative hydrolase of the HAD superfamily